MLYITTHLINEMQKLLEKTKGQVGSHWRAPAFVEANKEEHWPKGEMVFFIYKIYYTYYVYFIYSGASHYQ